MATSTVVVAGSNNDNSFAVIDFSNPAVPTKALATPSFMGGPMVDCSGSLAAAGNFNGSQVAIFDISTPASPVQNGIVSTGLSGIGALSFDGSHVLVGELNGQRAVLIDASSPAAPTIVSTFTTAIDSISAIALKGRWAVVSGPTNFYFVVLDYLNPASPIQKQFAPGTGGVFFGGAITCDLDGTRAVAADLSGGNVYLFDVSSGSPTLLDQFASSQAGVSSVSISGNEVAASSTNDFTVSLINFSSPGSPTGADTPSGLGGGAVVKLAGSTLVGGAVNDFDVTMYSVSGNSATAQGTDDTTLASIATLGFTTFVPVTSMPLIVLSATNLAFGAVRVGTASAPMPLTIKNGGTAPLHVQQLTTSAAQFVVAPSGSLAVLAPGANTVVHVTFTPSAEQPYAANLTMTDDPTHPAVTVLLTGSGGYPQVVAPGPLDFGSVAKCLTHSLNANVANTGPVALHLSSISVTGAGFSTAISSLTVVAGGSNPIPVTFKPAATGSLSGTLSFHTDDPSNPNVSVTLSGVGTPEPPPAILVTPSAINFGPAPLQYFIGLGVTVANTGPCEDLTVTLTVTGAAFLLTTGDPTTLPMSDPPISDTIAAAASKSYTVVFAPTAVGSASGTLTLTSNDPAHPSISVPLSGSGVTVSPAAIELILDRSGSMSTAISGGTRMTALQSAVSMFANLVIPGTGFAMGSVQFDTTEGVLTPLADFDATQQGAVVAGANSLFPRFLTSIGGGLQLGQTSLAATALPRKVAIVFTDGYENRPPMIATVEPTVLAAGTEVYAIGLGDPAYLSVAALGQLAASSNGKFFQTTDPLVLRKQFVEILADAFRQNIAVDPILNLQQGTPVAIPIPMTNCESRISFVVLWEDPSAQVQFSVRAPDGTTFGAGSGSNNRLVRYLQQPGYRFFQITLPPGPNRAIGPKQLGNWEMLIDPVSIPGGSTRASTTVLVESEIEIAVTIQATAVAQPLAVRARLTHSGAPIPNANVQVRWTAPDKSLASLMTPLVRHRAAAADTHHIPPALQNITATATTNHEARFNGREYLAQLPTPKVDGVYRAEITAEGKACGGTFARYWSGSVYVGGRGKR